MPSTTHIVKSKRCKYDQALIIRYTNNQVYNGFVAQGSGGGGVVKYDIVHMRDHGKTRKACFFWQTASDRVTRLGV